jgi:peptidylprolyl isomerase
MRIAHSAVYRFLTIPLLATPLACASPQTAEGPAIGRELAPPPGAEEGGNQPVKIREPVRTAEPSKPAPPPTRIATDTPADVASPPAEAVKSPSGLSYKVLHPGEGSQPGRDATVVVHYAGWTTKGDLFDSSVPRGAPLTIGLHQVIEGWTEGVATMQVGEVRRLWIPEALAYKGKPGAPAGMLVFDVELLGIE